MRWLWLCSSLNILWNWLSLGLKWNWSFLVLWPLLSFPNLWHIECSTFTASSFRIWNSSAGIPSTSLALCVVMLPKAHLTSLSRMSGSRYVITPSWLSGSWRSFLYSSSVHSCHPLKKKKKREKEKCQRMFKLSQLHLSHSKECSKFSKWRFNSTWTKNFQMCKLDLEKAEDLKRWPFWLVWGDT